MPQKIHSKTSITPKIIGKSRIHTKMNDKKVLTQKFFKKTSIQLKYKNNIITTKNRGKDISNSGNDIKNIRKFAKLPVTPEYNF